MACYRKGGCGPYEMCSCTDCPASKPDYLERETKTTTQITKEYSVKIPKEIPIEHFKITKDGVELHRTDCVWAYAFLRDFVSGIRFFDEKEAHDEYNRLKNNNKLTDL